MQQQQQHIQHMNLRKDKLIPNTESVTLFSLMFFNVFIFRNLIYLSLFFIRVGIGTLTFTLRQAQGGGWLPAGHRAYSLTASL